MDAQPATSIRNERSEENRCFRCPDKEETSTYRSNTLNCCWSGRNIGRTGKKIKFWDRIQKWWKVLWSGILLQLQWDNINNKRKWQLPRRKFSIILIYESFIVLMPPPAPNSFKFFYEFIIRFKLSRIFIFFICTFSEYTTWLVCLDLFIIIIHYFLSFYGGLLFSFIYLFISYLYILIFDFYISILSYRLREMECILGV